MADSTDVPHKFDLVINGHGYMLDRSYDDSPYRKPPAEYGYTPTFLERTNVGDNYGDDQQAFFLTASQNDWSLGEARRFFRSKDADGIRRFWRGLNLDVTTVPGQVSLAPQFTSSLTGATPGSVTVMVGMPTGIVWGDATKLYLVNAAGLVTDKGAHGLGATPDCIATDSKNVFISTSGAGTVGIRKWNGSTYSTFSATAADDLFFLNNILFGYSYATGTLSSYSTTGVASTIYTWQDGSGSALTGAAYDTKLRGYGGQLMILRHQGSTCPGELWAYNGTSTQQVAEFPENFVAKELGINSGIVFVSGYYSANGYFFPAVFYFDGSTVNQLWKSNVVGFNNPLATSPGTPTWPRMASYGEGIVFTDDSTQLLMQYNISIGGVHAIAGLPAPLGASVVAANQDFLTYTNGTENDMMPLALTASTGYLITSLFDFDNSLLKMMRGVKIEWDQSAVGDRVDVYYQFDSLDGAWTLLQSAAVSGTEYDLGSAQHHSVAFKIVLTPAVASQGPKLKRIFVRAAPVLTSFRNNDYLIDLTGNQLADPPLYLTLADGTTHTKDGEEMRADLVAAVGGPVVITDRFGTYTGVIEPGGSSFKEVRADYGRAEYRADIQVRQI